MNSKIIKVALIKPQLAGHAFRGTGAYFQNLYEALRKETQLKVEQKSIDDSYNSFDIVHYPYFDPFFLTLPLIRSKPTIVTVHDLIPLKFPDQFPKGIKGELKWQIQRRALKNVSAIITDSYASKADIAKFASISGDKIHVVYLGVGKDYKIIADRDILQKSSKKLGIPEEFILYVGDVNYNKNISGLMKAYSKLVKSFPHLDLVLIGNGFINESAQLTLIKNLISKLSLEDKIHLSGFIDEKDLVNIYNSAKVYVQPSFAEGFGLPVLEAMACGCPVVSSSASSLPEIVSDAGILTDPDDTEQLAKNIMIAYLNTNKRQDLISKGLKRVKHFTWEKCANQTTEIFRSLIINKT